MKYFLDTSIIMRLANRNDQARPIARNAIRMLHSRGHEMCFAPQILIEFRGSATRPRASNGLGMPPTLVELEIMKFESVFTLCEEGPDIYRAWKALVRAAGVIGKQVHDARLAAVCQVAGITHILTFNVRHFLRFVPLIPGLTIIDPANV